MSATYPNGIFAWTPKVDLVTEVDANDVNSMATEIQGIETIVGTTPQIEPSPPVGSAITYATMSSRLSAAMNNANLPVAVLTNAKGFFINAGQQIYNTYTRTYDPYGIFNGSDVTVPVGGYWSIDVMQRWNQHGNNFRGGNAMFLILNGNTTAFLDGDIWSWDDFFGDSQYNYAANVVAANGWTKVNWEGLLNKGDRLQLLSINQTFCPGIQVTNMTLHTHCIKTISGSFTSG
jgi:hypothetical protein